jgi:hypothetical protein
MFPQEITEFRRSAGKGRRASAAGPRQKPEMPELLDHGRDGRGELQAMIVIDIFKENHRSSN